MSREEGPPSQALMEAIEEIMRTYKSLPPRPTVEEVEAASSVIQTVETEEKTKLEEIEKRQVSKDVPEELCFVLKEFQKNMVMFQSQEQKKEAVYLIEVDKRFQKFDELIQSASRLVSGDTQSSKEVGFEEKFHETSRGSVEDESLVKKDGDSNLEEKEALKGVVRSGSSITSVFPGEGDSEKLSMMKVAAVIENAAKNGTPVLNLKGKLRDRIEWLPVTIGKLSQITELDVSDNRIMALPPTLGGLKALTRLYLHSNQLINLPESIGELINLQDLDLHANRLKSLPASFAKLTGLISLDLSSNEYSKLPELIGNLTRLERLNVETNQLEELPYTIGHCTSLVELRLDFNQLKGLPEAIGKLGCLQILALHYNRVKGLPTTMSNLSSLQELDVGFNEIESIPETLSFAVRLRKLNLGKNFADLRALPRSIGNLEALEELDISDNQITFLPDSFRYLSNLRVLGIDETPLQLPPREIAKLGAQVAVKYMEDYVAKRDGKTQPLKNKKKRSFWLWLCSLFGPGKTATNQYISDMA